MRKFIVIILVIAFVLTGASCKSGTNYSAGEPTEASADASPAESMPPESTGGDNNVIMLKGTIGDYPVHMSLVITDGVVTGSYYYDKVGKELKLEGSAEAGRMISMDEYDENGVLTGSFDGW